MIDPSISSFFDKLIADYLYLHLPGTEETREAVEDLLNSGFTVSELLDWTDYREDAVVMCVLARIAEDQKAHSQHQGVTTMPERDKPSPINMLPIPRAVEEADRAAHIGEIAEDLAEEFVVADLVDYYCTEEEAQVVRGVLLRMAEAVCELEEKLLVKKGFRAEALMASRKDH